MGSVMVEFELFFIFLRIALISFGGVIGLLPEIEREVVLRHHWMSSEEFYQMYVVAQVLPGPNMVMCPMIGFRVAGWTGMIAGFTGIYLVPSALMISVAWVYRKIQHHPAVMAVQRALQPTVVGLMWASVLRMWWVQIAANRGIAAAAGGTLCALLVTMASSRFRIGTLPLMAGGSLTWLLIQCLVRGTGAGL